MKRIAVFGAGGMLGRAVLAASGSAGTVGFRHRPADIADPNMVRWALRSSPLRPGFEVAINCAGVRPDGERATMARANALGPHVLAEVAAEMGVHVIHVSTDCVFDGGPPAWARSSGLPRWYEPSDTISPVDLYGRTKAAGELADWPNTTTVRTSFIGPNHGLLRFLIEASRRTNAPRAVHGYSRVYWTGSTVGAVARALVAMAEEPPGGTVHLATTQRLSKDAVLMLAVRGLGLDCNVIPVDEPRSDRSLRATYPLEELADALRRDRDSILAEVGRLYPAEQGKENEA